MIRAVLQCLECLICFPEYLRHLHVEVPPVFRDQLLLE